LAFLGDLISNEYDLEGTGESLGDWRDFFIANKTTTTTLAELHSNSRRNCVRFPPSPLAPLRGRGVGG
jgi:hypothetical protein